MQYNKIAPHRMVRTTLGLSTALTLTLAVAAPVMAQTTPGDRSGTPTAAGEGQSAASVTHAPATGPGVAAPPPTVRSGGGDVGEIIVTARRVEERLQDVPISITVFNQQQLNNRNIVQAGDLATYTPSLSSNGNFGSENTTFSIRGFVQEINTTPSVGVYFADVVAPRGAGTTPSGNGAGPGSFFDLQNVQVLKGPQGTLFGINTTGGAILLVPQKPTSQFGGYIEGSYGNYDMGRIQAVINVPVNDKVRFRIGVDHESRDGYAINDSGIGPSRFDNIDYTAARASLVIDLAPNIENYTIGSFAYSSTNGTVPRLFAGNPNLAAFPGPLAAGQIAQQAAKGNGITEQMTTTPNGQPTVVENASGNAYYRVQSDVASPESVLSQWQLINTTTWRYSDNLTIKNIASYAQLRDIERDSIFGTLWSFETAPFPFNILGKGPVQFDPVQPSTGSDTSHQSTATEEIQFQGNALDQKLVWQAGGFSEISEPLSPVGAESPQLISCTNIQGLQCTDFLGPLAGAPVGTVDFQTESIQYIDAGIYGQGTYALTDKLKFTAGARYTWDHSASSSNIGFYNFGQTVAGRFVGTPNEPVGFCQSVFVRPFNLPITSQSDCAQRFHQISQAPTWNFDLDYKPTDDVLLYAKYARGYRQGSVNPNAAEGFNTFKQEKVDTYELGTKTSFRWPIRGTFDITGFYNAFSQQQIQVGLLSSTNAVQENIGVVNAGESQIYGTEVESTLYPFDGFSFSVSYAYLNTLLESLASPSFVTGSRYDTFAFTSTPGSELPLSPQNKVSITGGYILPISQDIGKVTLGATFTYTSRILVSEASPFATLSPTRLLNLNLNWNSVFRKPIDLQVFATNVTQDHYFNYVAGLYGPAGFDSGQLGEPRMYGVRLRYHFGN